jgi:YegS/Rv2252/BmrU family lipid kinase
MKNLFFIYNPHSGQRIIGEYLDDILSYYSSEEYFVTCYATQYAGDARLKVQEYGKNFDQIVVAGGDGTLDEVVSGAVKAGIDPIIGYIPTGSTNDFAKSLRIPEDIEKAVPLSINGNVKKLDVGDLEGHYFTYVAAFGSLAEVSYETDQNLKNIFGRSAYIVEGLRAASNFKSYDLEVTIDGETIKDEFIHGMFTNSVSVGGFTTIVGENVGLDDNIFEVMLVREPKKIPDYNQIINGFRNGRENDFVLYREGSEFAIKTKEDLVWTLDGEYGGKTKDCTIKILHKAVKIRTGLK